MFGRRVAWMAAALAGLVAQPAEAVAQDNPQTSCGPGESVEADLGIHGIGCRNCTLHLEGEERRWRFLSEPEVLTVGPGTPADGKVQRGDVITAIDGTLITTTEGGRRFANLQVGEAVTLTLRRDGKISRVRLVPEARCKGPLPPDPETPTLPDAVEVPELPRLPDIPRELPSPEGIWPSGWFGFGISCNCDIRSRGEDQPPVWSFRGPPEIHSIEPGSPADRVGLETGDVLLEIDGVPLTREEGGRRFGAVQERDTVRFDVRSGDQTRSVTLVAEPRPLPGLFDSVILEGDRLRREVGRRQRELKVQQRLLEALERRMAGRDSVALGTLTREMLAGERVERELLLATYSHLLGKSNRLLGSNRLRFTGSVGNVDVEVRGDDRVVVTVVEEDREIVIVAGGTRIRLKASTQ